MDDDWPWIITGVLGIVGYTSLRPPDGFMLVAFGIGYLGLTAISIYGAYNS